MKIKQNGNFYLKINLIMRMNFSGFSTELIVEKTILTRLTNILRLGFLKNITMDYFEDLTRLLVLKMHELQNPFLIP